MRIALVAARAANGVIGAAGGLPWHLPDDLRRFKALTLGRTVVVGRRTWQSIGRALPGRRWIVVTRDPAFRAEGAETAPDLAAAYGRAGADVVVAGGAAVYAAALPDATHLYLTEVEASPTGDTFFPPVDLARWRLVREERHAADARHAHAFTFRDYER